MPDQSMWRCPDGGTCHHQCTKACFRVIHCGPLGAAGYANNAWPTELVAAHEAAECATPDVDVTKSLETENARLRAQNARMHEALKSARALALDTQHIEEHGWCGDGDCPLCDEAGAVLAALADLEIRHKVEAEGVEEILQHEYAVMMYKEPQVPHRRGTQEWCEQWVRAWEGEEPQARPGMFYVAERDVSAWVRRNPAEAPQGAESDGPAPVPTHTDGNAGRELDPDA